MKEYLLSENCADLAILMTGGPKPEYYICKKVLILIIFDQVLNG